MLIMSALVPIKQGILHVRSYYVALYYVAEYFCAYYYIVQPVWYCGLVNMLPNIFVAMETRHFQNNAL